MELNDIAPLIAVHLVAATYVLVLGPVQILRRRRDRMHRMLGAGWVLAIAVTCLTSFGIRSTAGFSWLHALSVFTLVTVTLGVLAAVRHDSRAHRGNMIGSYFGTVAAFVWAAADPERLIRQVSTADPLGFLLAAGLVLATAGALVLTLQRTLGRPRRGVPAA
ncbi:Uncharacterized membrane protein [Raineyella antarctica]|uniref:Uncharacterized membrane protein n=1 Tax=Raineyella antarctica TaxID=1577474 RepID=A0A1G6HST8_9ACTN|nr:DUF2306 domain-containing protein [Raineyella antarctica]SDB97367.1 Uncharacterized membrane protein [Raineyella antarctica]